jgi:hypothetical protein
LLLFTQIAAASMLGATQYQCISLYISKTMTNCHQKIRRNITRRQWNLYTGKGTVSTEGRQLPEKKERQWRTPG